MQQFNAIPSLGSWLALFFIQSEAQSQIVPAGCQSITRMQVIIENNTKQHTNSHD